MAAWVSYRTYYRTPASAPARDPADRLAKLSHRQCHLPLAPREHDGEDEEAEMGRGNRVRLLSEENDAMPRSSEEEVAWRQ